MWFQHDGVPAHFSTNVRNYLNATFGARWIGRGGPVPWPPRSPDLSSLDYLLWGHLKSPQMRTSEEQWRRIGNVPLRCINSAAVEDSHRKCQNGYRAVEGKSLVSRKQIICNSSKNHSVRISKLSVSK
ncbi:hypothetical protein AVEN_91142-1 [Araneus ventricosus]|uniref:Transposable element Tc3 transposase n=1 Tax=Araneus ventricosus TaxID=182803 RepID=A0A4Y2E7G6_ARAVE|nr:hypothetical protein AVEN_91142-1 [Araneus ventricosus]